MDAVSPRRRDGTGRRVDPSGNLRIEATTMTDEHDHNGGPEGSTQCPASRGSRLGVVAHHRMGGQDLAAGAEAAVEIARSPERAARSRDRRRRPRTRARAARRSVGGHERGPGALRGDSATSTAVAAIARSRGPELAARGGRAAAAHSRDVHYEDDAHPAYERILSSWSPTRGGSCGCCCSTGRSRRSTSAPADRSDWSAHG